METSFPDRYYVLRKYFLIEILIFIVLIAVTVGCEPNKEYTVEPVPIFSKVLLVDSAYTKVKVTSTGGSTLLFCGKKDIFDSYSIIKFDSIPENFDSLFLRFASDTFTCELTLFALEQEWSEDSVYEWDDIGSIFDTTNPIRVATLYPVHVDSPATDTNSLVFLGNSISLDEPTINAIGNYGLAVHSNQFYDFKADSTKLKIESDDTLAPSSILCTEDAVIVKNPFQDSVFTDSLLVGNGISIRTHIIIPRDSLPSLLDLNSIAKAELYFGVLNTMPFDVGFISYGSNYLYTRNADSESDSLKFDLAYYFRELSHDSILDLQIRATNNIGGIGTASLGDIENIGIQFIWVEFPR